MPKKEKGAEPAKEESPISFMDWASLTFAPQKYMTALSHISLRLKKILEKSKSDSDRNFARQTLLLLEQFGAKMNEDFKPSPPKVLNDAYDYALSRNYQGTFIALLDETGNLVKTVIVAKERLKSLPEFTMTEEVVPMQMTAKFINIPSLEIKRNVPKRVVKAVPFSSDMKQIYGYSEK